MKQPKDGRLHAFHSLKRLYNLEMEALQSSGLHAREQLYTIEDGLENLDREIDLLEEKTRVDMAQGQSIAIDGWQLTQDYIQKKHTVRLSKDKQRQQAEKQVELLTDQMKQQHLQIRGVNKMHKRRLKGLQVEMERRQLTELDESWLQRQGKNDG